MDCIFCKIIAREIPSWVVYEDDECIAFLNIHPVAPGHTLVVPKKHAENMLADESAQLRHLVDVVQTIAPKVMRATQSTGFNLGVNTGADAGQVIMHTHWHIIPRKAGDGLKTWEHTTAATEDLDVLKESIKTS